MKPLPLGCPRCRQRRHRCTGAVGADLHLGSGRCSTTTPCSFLPTHQTMTRAFGRSDGKEGGWPSSRRHSTILRAVGGNADPRHRSATEGGGAAHLAAAGRAAGFNDEPQAKVVRTSFLCIKGEVGIARQEGHKVATMQRVISHRGALKLCRDRNTSRDSSQWPLFRPRNAQLRPRRMLPRAGQWAERPARAPRSPF
jgi:hypothetical protein